MHARPPRPIPGLGRGARRREPRPIELILGITAVLVLLAGCLRLLAAVSA